MSAGQAAHAKVASGWCQPSQERGQAVKHLNCSGFMRLLPVFLLLGLLFAGCGDDNGGGPDLIVVSDFEGTWVVEQYKVTSVANPAVSMELISLGGAMEFNLDKDGTFEGRGFVPASVAGMKLELPFAGNLQLISQDSVTVTFTPEQEPFLTDTRAAFTLDGNTVAISDSNTVFDFDGDTELEPAIFEAVMAKTDDPYPTVIFTEDFEGFWEALSYTATSVANPAMSIETVAMGAVYEFDVDASGEAVGYAFIPAALTGGEDVTIPDFDASFEIIYQDTMMIVFNPVQLPFLVNAGGAFTLEGETCTLTDENAFFDFDGDEVPEPAIAEIVLERTGNGE
jgi:hypothetical protein